jgi:hypothetical protein
MAQQRGAVRSTRRAAGQLRMCEHLRGARTRGGWVGREGVKLVKQEAREPKKRERWFYGKVLCRFPVSAHTEGLKVACPFLLANIKAG